ncbi:uncharacterized protein LOC127258880 [Andrographis paniculata]|uniref:uncharacterized protein LOC127258880 n=1 Tax=Andrographis paniculata TaxID=175694 RepID=UPI0021E9AD42|nr:uncharacterized protein LOC127258880 [Andrographis paniculata]XP_051141898.1 uncharacterized protein LOC127258880 [Andrographis paniculata]
MGKNVMFGVKKCLKSVCNHPFLICTLCFLMFIRRSFPVFFSLLMSAAPVFVCTAVLLGALLNLGRSDVAETDVHDTAAESAGKCRGCHFRDRRPPDVAGKAAVESREVSDHVESDVESFDSERVNVDSPPESPWLRVEEIRSCAGGGSDDGDVEDDDMMESSSGSGGSTSSSPAATSSMVDIMPLDELHPLLDEDGSVQLVPLSLRGSQAMSEVSPESSSGNESDVETETQSDAPAKPAITWTEEDQRNLQDLGCSEIERNQRLESLMQRRRQRKYQSMVPEMNLIDLEATSAGPHNVAPIATGRRQNQNPFDEGNENPGMPPVPGSAPSVLLPGRNPFDAASYSGEERAAALPPLPRRGGGFQEVFMRRNESLIAEKLDAKLRPFFVAESPFCQPPAASNDSRLSSVPETASVSSVEDTDVDTGRVAEEVEVPESRGSDDHEIVSAEVDGETPEEESKEEVGSGSEVVDTAVDDSSSTSEASGRVSDDDEASKDSQDIDISTRTDAPVDEASKDDSNIDDVSTHSPTNEASKDDIDIDASTQIHTPIDESQHKVEPVYDSSPPSIKKPHPESAGDFLPSFVKQTVSLIGRTWDGITGESSNPPDAKNPTNDSDEAKHLVESLPKVVSSSIEKNTTSTLDNDDDDDDDEDYQEASVKISTPSARESAAVLYNIPMNNPSAKRLEEVQVPNTPVDAFDKLRSIPNLNITNIHELIDTRSHVGSPYTPDLTSMPSMPSSASKESAPQFSMQTILEEVSEANQTDGMSGSDSEGEIYWRARPTAFDKYVESAEGSSSPDSQKLDASEKLDSADGNKTDENRIEDAGEPKIEPHGGEAAVETGKENVRSTEETD